MIFTIHDTDIFDTEIDIRLKKLLLEKIGEILHDYTYILKVTFPVELLSDSRIKYFNLPSNFENKNRKEEDKIYDVMNYQLEKIEGVLKENNIEVYSTYIQGDEIEARTIRIEIIEEGPKVEIKGKAKNKQRLKVSSIIPSLKSTQENISKVAGERLSKIFLDVMKAVNSNKKIMSYALGINETEDEQKLFNAFTDKYGELWLTTKEREIELLEQLSTDLISGVNRFFEQNKTNEL